MIISAVDS